MAYLSQYLHFYRKAHYWNIPLNCTLEPVLPSKQQKQSGKKAEFSNEGDWNKIEISTLN